MSNRQLEERQEAEFDQSVADVLGISFEDMTERTSFEVHTSETSDGELMGYNVQFGPDSDPAVLSQIRGLTNGYWVRIGPVL